MSIYAFQLFKALIFPTLTVVNLVRKTEIHDFISSPATELRKKNRSNICFIISFLTLKLPEGEFVCNKKKHFLFRKLINFLSKHISSSVTEQILAP